MNERPGVEYRDYECLCCGHVTKIQTNHTGNCFNACPSCSWRSNFVEPGHPLNFKAYEKNRPCKYVGD